MSKEILDKILKSNETEHHVFLLWGEEDFLRAHYKKNLISLFMPQVMPDLNFYAFDGKDYSVTAVDEAIEALPVMDTQKLLVFENSYLFKPDERTGAKAETREYWEKRLKDIPDYVYIIFCETDIDKRSSLFKQIAKNHLAAEFSYLDESKMSKWTQALFKKLGKNITLSDCNYLLSLCPDGMMTIKREAEKLCAYAAAKDDVTKDDIDLLVTPKLEDKVFDMVSFMLSKNAEKSLSLLHDLFSLKTEPAQIMGAVIYNIEKITCVKSLQQTGKSRQEIASVLKLAPFMVNKFSDIASRFKPEELNTMIANASKIDMQLKTNSMDNNVLLELFITESATY